MVHLGFIKYLVKCAVVKCRQLLLDSNYVCVAAYYL